MNQVVSSLIEVGQHTVNLRKLVAVSLITEYDVFHGDPNPETHRIRAAFTMTFDTGGQFEIGRSCREPELQATREAVSKDRANLMSAWSDFLQV